MNWFGSLEPASSLRSSSAALLYPWPRWAQQNHPLAERQHWLLELQNYGYLLAAPDSFAHSCSTNPTMWYPALHLHPSIWELFSSLLSYWLWLSRYSPRHWWSYPSSLPWSQLCWGRLIRHHSYFQFKRRHFNSVLDFVMTWCFFYSFDLLYSSWIRIIFWRSLGRSGFGCLRLLPFGHRFSSQLDWMPLPSSLNSFWVAFTQHC